MAKFSKNLGRIYKKKFWVGGGGPTDPKKNGINCTTGSLGHGLPIATGMAFARKKQKIPGKI